MTGEDRMRAELEGLEQSAPADLPPRPPLYHRPAWLRLAAPAAVMILAGVLIGISLPAWLEGIRPLASTGPSTPSPSAEPSSSEQPASIDIECIKADAQVCARVAEVAMANLASGLDPSSITVVGFEPQSLAQDVFAVTVRFSGGGRPVDLNCGVSGGRETCSAAVPPAENEVQIGVAYPITLWTHCGLHAVEFDGSRWVIEAAPTDDGINNPEGFGDPDHGTVTLSSENEGVYRSQEGVERRITRGGGVPFLVCF